MKRFIAIPLIVLYLTAISGMMVQLHYCGSKLSSWSVNKQKASCCCEGQGKGTAQGHERIAASSGNCCSDKTITLKVAEAQHQAADLQLKLSALQCDAWASTLPGTGTSDVLSERTLESCRANAPPGRWQDIPLYKLHSRFIYYS